MRNRSIKLPGDNIRYSSRRWSIRDGSRSVFCRPEPDLETQAYHGLRHGVSYPPSGRLICPSADAQPPSVRRPPGRPRSRRAFAPATAVIRCAPFKSGGSRAPEPLHLADSRIVAEQSQAPPVRISTAYYGPWRRDIRALGMDPGQGLPTRGHDPFSSAKAMTSA